ncbi:MAG: nucleoside monophosphate kinase [Patescibacteria group bacterium]
MKSHKSISSKLSLVVMGRSGSGKGTQAQYILDRLGKGAHHIETGRVLRELLTHENPTAILARDIMKTGGLFPGWFGSFAWLRELIERGCADGHLIFDGAPRKVQEAELMNEVIKWHRRPLPFCIYVDVSEKQASARLLARGRDDDHPVAIRNRMQFFKKDVLPVIEFYRRSKRLIHVDGERPIEEVWQEIDKKLSMYFKHLWPLPSKQKKK